MSDQILNLPEFLERVQNDNELLLELLDIYIEDFQLKRPLMADAVSNKDSEELRSLAHSLKGASGNISAKILQGIFTSIEENSKQNNIEGMEETFKELDKQFADLLTRIDEIRKELG